MKDPTLFFILGFMASGKSTWGKIASKNLELPCIDLDEVIVQKAGKPITDIFEEGGEVAFRKLEEACLYDLLNLPKGSYIVSCGGGTPCFFENMKWMNTHGTTIFLDVSTDTIVDRLFNASNHRPILKGLEKEEIEAFILPLLKERNTFYQQSKYILKDTEDILKKVNRNY